MELPIGTQNLLQNSFSVVSKSKGFSLYGVIILLNSIPALITNANQELKIKETKAAARRPKICKSRPESERTIEAVCRMVTDSAIELYEIYLPRAYILCSFALFVYAFLPLIRIISCHVLYQPFGYITIREVIVIFVASCLALSSVNLYCCICVPLIVFV